MTLLKQLELARIPHSSVLSEMVEPAICDEKTESGEASDLEVSTPA